MKNGGADERLERTRELLQSSVEGRGRERVNLGASVVLGTSAPEGAGGGELGSGRCAWDSVCLLELGAADLSFL